MAETPPLLDYNIGMPSPIDTTMGMPPPLENNMGMPSPVENNRELPSPVENKLSSSNEGAGLIQYMNQHEKQIPGGTKENPIELQPVRISSGTSIHTFDHGPPSPEFSQKNSHERTSSSRLNEERKIQTQASHPTMSRPIPGVSVMLEMNRQRHGGVSQSNADFPGNDYQTFQNDRSHQPPVRMSLENTPQYSSNQRQFQ